VNILEALDDPHLFAPHFVGSSWAAWKGFLAALFALSAPDGTTEAYGACTGRAKPPGAPFTEAALIVGRRGGKSRILALVAVYLAVFRDYVPHLAPGEVATIAVLAANRPQARSIFRYISGILKAVPLFARTIVDENTEAITLTNRVVIEIGTASFRTTRGYSFAAVLCDEIAFWRLLDSGANEILAAGAYEDTSPAVTFAPGTGARIDVAGAALLLEPPPMLLDHIALAAKGVWTRDGEPGVDNSNVETADKEKVVA